MQNIYRMASCLVFINKRQINQNKGLISLAAATACGVVSNFMFLVDSIEVEVESRAGKSEQDNREYRVQNPTENRNVVCVTKRVN